MVSISALTSIHSGYGGYGIWERGARQILIRKTELEISRVVETWIRNFVGDVMLNGTYGIDEYPVTPDSKTRCPTCDYTVVTGT